MYEKEVAELVMLVDGPLLHKNDPNSPWKSQGLNGNQALLHKMQSYQNPALARIEHGGGTSDGMMYGSIEDNSFQTQ